MIAIRQKTRNNGGDPGNAARKIRGEKCRDDFEELQVIDINGGCHCGAISVRFRSERSPDELQIRACQCGFCRKHGVKTVTDTDGHVEITVVADDLSRYQFGQSVADFLVCRRCGVYVAAIMARDGTTVATLNVNTLENNPFATRTGETAYYENESAESRGSRRLRMWTPTTLVTLS